MEIFKKSTEQVKNQVDVDNLENQEAKSFLESLKWLVWLKEDIKEWNKQGSDIEEKNTVEWLDKKQKKIYDRLQAFQKWMPIAKKYVNITDGTIPMETLVWLIPGIGDMGTWITNASIMGFFGSRLSMWLWYQFKNFAMQTVDTWVWVVPIIGDVADAFFKSNRRMYRNFVKAYDRLIKKAEKSKLPSKVISQAKEKYDQSKLEWGVARRIIANKIVSKVA